MARPGDRSDGAFVQVVPGPFKTGALHPGELLNDDARGNNRFGAFQRQHSGSHADGVGIGLATAVRIIRRHGGRSWCEAAAGTGPTFCFTR